MAIETVPQTTDKTLIEDWRTGVIKQSAHHVWGATALDDTQWQLLDTQPRRDGRPHGVLLVDQRSVCSGEPVPGGCHCVLPDHLAVAAKYRRLSELTPGAFDPEHGPYRIVVTEVFR